jgi:hypothetical protein
MNNLKRYLLASGMGAALILGAAPAMAQSQRDNGGLSSYGYTDQLRPGISRQNRANASQDRTQTRVRRQDNPPGSSFQDEGNRESIGE